MEAPHFAIRPAESRVGPVKIGMTRSEVHAAMGPPEEASGQRETFLQSFFVDYDEDGKVEFIELSNTVHYRVTFEGVALLEVSAGQALGHLAKFAEFDAEEDEVGCLYFYPDLNLSLWRHFESDDVDFETVGLARPGYYDDED